MKKMKVVLISLVATLSIPAALLYTNYTIDTQPDSVVIKEQPILPRVTVQRVSVGTFTSLIDVFGEVKAEENLTLLSQTSGQVVWKSDKFSVGNVVKKGTLLLRIEDVNYRVSLANAKKNLASAHLALLQEQRKQKRAQQDWKRSGITGKPSELALRKPQLDMAKTEYKAAEEQVAFAQNNLENTKIYAPFEGVITARSVTLGTLVSQQGNIATLKSVASAEIKVALSENEWQQLPEIVHGEKVVVQSTYRSEQHWNGLIDNLDLFVNENNRARNMTVKIAEPLEQSPPLLFGSFVRVQIQGKEQKETFKIPSSAVTSDGHIWFEQDQRLVKYKVSVRFNSDQFVGIDRGDLPKQLNLVRQPLAKYIQGMQVVSVLMKDDSYVN